MTRMIILTLVIGVLLVLALPNIKSLQSPWQQVFLL